MSYGPTRNKIDPLVGDAGAAGCSTWTWCRV